MNEYVKKFRKRTKIIVDKEFLDKIRQFSGLRLTQGNICAYFGIAETTFSTMKKRSPEIVEAMQKGIADTTVLVTSKLIEKIHGGNLKAIMFFLERKCGWVNQQKLDIVDDMQIKIDIPKLKLPDDAQEAAKIYQKFITGKRGNNLSKTETQGMSETVQANDGTMLPLDSITNTIAYSGSFVSTITVNYQGNTYVQTFTNNGTNITVISNWVKQ